LISPSKASLTSAQPAAFRSPAPTAVDIKASPAGRESELYRRLQQPQKDLAVSLPAQLGKAAQQRHEILHDLAKANIQTSYLGPEKVNAAVLRTRPW
jgi:hypothetical protein